MIFLFAGHSLSDPGAISPEGITEAQLTIEFRDLVFNHLPSDKVIRDQNEMSLAALIKQIRPGSGSVLLDCHFNSAGKTATGTEVIVADNANKDSINFAGEIARATAGILKIPNRGVRSEKESHRGRLGILHTPAGIAALSEIAFINNIDDLQKYQAKKEDLAVVYASILLNWDALRS